MIHENSKNIKDPHTGFPIMGGHPSPYDFFRNPPPIKIDAPHLKMKPLSEKQSPYWNVKHTSMKWFLEKGQYIIT